MMIEVAIADGSGPYRHVGTVVTATLTSARANFTGGGKLMLFKRLDQGGSQRFAATKSTVAQVDAHRRLCHAPIIRDTWEGMRLEDGNDMCNNTHIDAKKELSGALCTVSCIDSSRSDPSWGLLRILP